MKSGGGRSDAPMGLGYSLMNCFLMIPFSVEMVRVYEAFGRDAILICLIQEPCWQVKVSFHAMVPLVSVICISIWPDW